MSLLTACGGSDYEAGTPTALSAAQVRVGIEAPLAASSPQALTPAALDTAPAGLETAAPGVEIAESGVKSPVPELEAAAPGAEIGESGGKNPVADCEPENCQGLRIIDGNAEAYRFNALRRSAAEAGSAS